MTSHNSVSAGETLTSAGETSRQRTGRWLVLLFVSAISLSYAFLDWEIYRQKFLVHPDGWMLYFSGGIQAPWQYRIGVWEAVLWLHQWFHLKAYDALTLIDVLCLALSLWLVLRVLRNFEDYKIASAPIRWLAMAGVLFLTEYYLVWGHWFQTEDTMPSILFVTLSVALVCGEIVQSRVLACLLLVGLGWDSGIHSRGCCSRSACRIFSCGYFQQTEKFRWEGHGRRRAACWPHWPPAACSCTLCG